MLPGRALPAHLARRGSAAAAAAVLPSALAFSAAAFHSASFVSYSALASGSFFSMLFPALEQRLVLRVGGEQVAADPGLAGRAAPGVVDQADRHVERLVELAAEEVADGRELPDGLGRADLPLALEVVLRLLRADLGHGDQADLGILRRRDLEVGVVGRGRPTTACSTGPSRSRPRRRARRRSVTVFLPLTVSVCGPPAGIGSSVTGHLPSAPALVVLALVGDLDRDLLARARPSPRRGPSGRAGGPCGRRRSPAASRRPNSGMQSAQKRQQHRGQACQAMERAWGIARHRSFLISASVRPGLRDSVAGHWLVVPERPDHDCKLR